MSHHLVHLREEKFVKNVVQKEGHETVDAGSMIGFVPICTSKGTR
jgi:hypothetical protein